MMSHLMLVDSVNFSLFHGQPEIRTYQTVQHPYYLYNHQLSQLFRA